VNYIHLPSISQKRRNISMKKLYDLSLLELLEMSTDNLRKLIIDHSNQNGLKWWLIGEESEGRKNVLIVAHIDKSLENKEIAVLYDPKRHAYMSPFGLGADDRAGVYAALQIHKKMPANSKPLLLFCDEEEKGGVGAREAAEDLESFIKKNILFMVEYDRKGKNGAVFYNKESKRFKKFVKRFGFTEETGSFSDIASLGKKTGVAGVNLSAGYYNQHTLHESLNAFQLEKNIATGLKMIKQGLKEAKTYHCQVPKPVKPVTKGKNFGHTPRRDHSTHRQTPPAEKHQARSELEVLRSKISSRQKYIRADLYCWHCNNTFPYVGTDGMHNGTSCPTCDRVSYGSRFHIEYLMKMAIIELSMKYLYCTACDASSAMYDLEEKICPLCGEADEESLIPWTGMDEVMDGRGEFSELLNMSINEDVKYVFDNLAMEFWTDENWMRFSWNRIDVMIQERIKELKIKEIKDKAKKDDKEDDKKEPVQLPSGVIVAAKDLDALEYANGRIVKLAPYNGNTSSTHIKWYHCYECHWEFPDILKSGIYVFDKCPGCGGKGTHMRTVKASTRSLDSGKKEAVN
jgi:hypothetical protein